VEFLRNVIIGQYVPGDSLIHRLDPRVKIVLAMLLIIEILFVQPERLWCIFLPLAFLLIVVVLSRLSVSYILRGLKSVVILVFITFLFNIFFTEGTPLYRLWFLTITREGLIFGVLMAMRLIIIVLATSILTLSTSPIQITDALENLMKGGKIFKLPVHEIAMMMSIALRFIPTLMEQLEKIIKAQMARGADFEKGSLMRRARSFIPILIPLFVQAFKHADDLAIAMEARCYRGGEGRTRLKILKAGLNDLVAVIIAGAFFVALALLSSPVPAGLW
jgi:energy-coupling factor transport system permease protein